MDQDRVLGRRPQIGAKPGALDREPGGETHDEGGNDDPGAVVRQEHEAKITAALQLGRDRIGLAGGTELLAECSLDDQRQTKGQQEAVKVVEPVDVAQQKALDRNPEGADDDRSQNQRRPISKADRVQQKPGAERAQHVLRTVREVDDVEEPEDDRQPEAQHRIEGAVDHPDEQLGEHRRRWWDREVNPVEHWGIALTPQLAALGTPLP